VQLGKQAAREWQQANVHAGEGTGELDGKRQRWNAGRGGQQGQTGHHAARIARRAAFLNRSCAQSSGTWADDCRKSNI